MIEMKNNIEKAISACDLTNSNMLDEVYANFMGDGFCGLHGLQIDRESNTAKKGFVGYECLDSSIVFRECVYISPDDKKLHWLFLDNPSIPGSNSIRFKMGGNEERVMITSGRLTGCGFAVLFKEDFVYIIHAGGANHNKDKTIDPKKRNLLINKDILNAVLFRDDRSSLYDYGIDSSLLVSELVNNGFSGFIYSPKHDTSRYIVEKKNIVLEQYIVDNVIHYNRYCELCANVVALIHPSKVSIALRQIIDHTQICYATKRYLHTLTLN